MKLISVITPVYNSKEFLNKCIESIINQTYKSFELILIDDGSTDGSSELCDKWALKDNRIRVIHQDNQGQAVARNRALDICKGDYIAFVDSDDYIHPEMFSVLLRNIRESGADLAVCNHITGKEADYEWKKLEESFDVYTGKSFLRKCLLEKKNKSWLLWDKLYRRNCFENIRLPNGRIYEDNATVYKIIYGSDKIVDCNDELYYYYTNDDSTVNQKFNLKHLDWLLVLEEMILFFEKNNEKELFNWANKSYLNSLADLYIKVCQYCPDKNIENELKIQLRNQYKIEKNKYEISIKTYPHIIEVLKPNFSKMYWIFKRLTNYFRKSM